MGPDRAGRMAGEKLRARGPAASLFVALFLIAGCAGTDRGPPPAAWKADGAAGRYKVGAPYTVDGILYRPAVDYSYAETGVASWYGPQFHGRSTANGETFDMNALTAAHRTLPMPSVVRVTNLENGRTLLLRVNDRGPFAHRRIIDVSRRASQLLGFRYQGVARVRVEILAEESRRVAAIARGEAPPATAVAAVPAEVEPPVKAIPASAARPMLPVNPAVPPAAIEESPIPPPAPAAGAAVYVQAGAFRDLDNAERVRGRLSTLAPAVIVPAPDGAELYRVRLGPFGDRAAADGVRAAIAAGGGPEAQVISD